MDPSQVYDLVVVGSGPSGAAAARAAALRGLSVLVIEQATMPRAKPCGGCLSKKIDGILDASFHSVVEKTIFGATFTAGGYDTLHVRSETPVAYMVTRDRFDHFLSDHARRAGARILEACRVIETAETADGVTVRTAGQEYQCRYLIGADGANGVVGRRPDLSPRRRLAVCLEGEITLSREVEAPRDDEVRIEFGSIPFGYGWVFPKEGHISVGVGGLRDRIDNPRAYYDAFLADQELLDAIEAESRRGWIIPVHDGGRPLASARTLLVGDAASLVDPFLGEGIYYAIRSGQLAAEAVAAAIQDASAPPASAAYQDAVRRTFYPDFQAAARIARFMFGFPRVGIQVLRRRPSFVRTYFGVLRGEETYEGLWKDLRRHAATDAARVAWEAFRGPRDVAARYDRMAPRYDESLRLWRTLVAQPAWTDLGALLGELTPPGAAVLDAATGTGALVELLLDVSDPGSVVGLDLSKGMLRQARGKIQDPRVTWKHGDITSLPFPDDSFDVVASSWALETLQDPRAAVAEFLRVLKPGGRVIYAFSSRPETRPIGRLQELVLAWSDGRLGARARPRESYPFHDCGRSHLIPSSGGLAAVVVLAKCCSVETEEAPCLPSRSGTREGEAGGPALGDAQ